MCLEQQFGATILHIKKKEELYVLSIFGDGYIQKFKCSCDLSYRVNFWEQSCACEATGGNSQQTQRAADFNY